MYFTPPGSEAIDVAIKTAVLATGRNRLLAFQDGYRPAAVSSAAV